MNRAVVGGNARIFTLARNQSKSEYGNVRSHMGAIGQQKRLSKLFSCRLHEDRKVSKFKKTVLIEAS